MTTLMSAFPVVGSELLYTAAFFIDVPTMKFATYQLGRDGTLQLNLGWGHAGTAAIKNYGLEFDTGLGSAGVAVFQTDPHGRSTSGQSTMGQLACFVNLALGRPACRHSSPWRGRCELDERKRLRPGP